VVEIKYESYLFGKSDLQKKKAGIMVDIKCKHIRKYFSIFIYDHSEFSKSHPVLIYIFEGDNLFYIFCQTFKIMIVLFFC
jgi:hypothetical protein